MNFWRKNNAIAALLLVALYSSMLLEASALGQGLEALGEGQKALGSWQTGVGFWTGNKPLFNKGVYNQVAGTGLDGYGKWVSSTFGRRLMFQARGLMQFDNMWG